MADRGAYTFPVCSEECLIKYIQKLPDIMPAVYPVMSSLDFKSPVEKVVFYKLSRKFDIYYEPFKFQLSRRVVYVPDFFIPSKGIFIETKGRRITRKWKLNIFNKTYELFIITKACLEVFGWR